MAKNFYKGKNILVTGGAGSIGSYLVRQLLTYEPETIRVFDNNETGLFNLCQELKTLKVRTLVGDVRDKDRLVMAFDNVDIVFHASALKHVPLCEYNPFDAVKTNVIGTQNVLEAALAQEVEKVINVSTDKAVSPTNVMGATKLLAERLTISANFYRGYKKTVFSSVRFGNVMNSRGSVIPTFESQIKSGGPVTITHPDMTRFIMDIPQAASLIIKAAEIARGRDVFILKMPSLRILDLAEAMIEELAPGNGYDPHDFPIIEIGKREGEKMYEELMTEEETASCYESDDMYIINAKHYSFEEPTPYQAPKGFKKTGARHFSSNDGKILDKDEIKALIRGIYYNNGNITAVNAMAEKPPITHKLRGT